MSAEGREICGRESRAALDGGGLGTEGAWERGIKCAIWECDRWIWR